MKEQVLATPIIQLRAYSKTELAQLYKLSMKSLTKWLIPLEKELGPRRGRFYNPKQVEIIFKEFGIPKMMHCS
jgi:hypothetical protein